MVGKMMMSMAMTEVSTFDRNETALKVKQLTDFAAELEEELRIKTNQIERLKRQLGQEGPATSQVISRDGNESSGDPASPAEIVQSLKDEIHCMQLKR